MFTRIVILALFAGFWLLAPRQGQAATEDLRFLTVSLSPQARVQPGGLVVLTAMVANRGADTAEAILVANVEGETDRQSARRVVVRGKQQSQYDVYVNLPTSIIGKEFVTIELTLVAQQDGREVLLKRDGAPVSYSVKLAVAKTNTHAGLAVPSEPQALPAWYWPGTPVYASYELAIATRLQAGNTRLTANYDRESPPIGINDLQGLDVFVVADERVLHDASTRAALKHFAGSGGRVWLMLDNLAEQTVQSFLAPGQSLAVIDEVDINDFVIDVASPNVRLAEIDRTVSLEDPAKLKRIVQSGGKVLASVDGWPAIVSMPSGYGEVVISTLQSSAWIRPRTQQPSTSSLFQSPYEVRPWAVQFASAVNDVRRPLPMSDTETEYPLQHIGNPIVPRSWVAVALLSFCAVIALSGFVKFLGVDLLWIGIAAPVLALLFGGALLIASTTIRSDKVDSVSRLQIVEFSGNGTKANVREKAAVYLNSNESMSLISQSEGVAIAEGVSSGVTRFLTDDFGKWQLSNENWRPGTWRYESNYTLDTPPLIATAELTEKGIKIVPPAGLPGGLSDPVIGYVAGDLLLCSSDGDTFSSDGSLVADGSRWIDAAFVTDEQQRRMEVYSKYFSFDERTLPLERVLFGWTDTWPAGPQWDKQLKQQGSALVALPLQIKQPAVGQEIFVPHGLIKLKRDVASSGQTFSYNELTGEWADELTIGATAGLRLELPAQVLPMQVDEIQLSLDMTAPHRDVVLYAVVGQSKQEILQLKNPSLPVNETIRDPELLKAMGEGSLRLELSVSERTDVSENQPTSNVVAWRVRHLRASVSGQRRE